MRRALAAIVVVVTTVAAADASAAAEEARLVLRDRTPLTLDGIGFRGHQRVAFTVRAPGLVIQRTVRTTENGRVRVVFRRLSLTGALRCAYGVTVAARAGGELVLWRPPKLPDCPSPSQPPA